MIEHEDLVGSEIAEHLSILDGWIGEITTIPVTESRRGVNERFVQDCRHLKSYLTGVESPSAADLCDFGDRRNSLEIQYNNILEERN